MSNLVEDYIQKRTEEPGLFSFEYNLLPKLISILLPLHGPGISLRYLVSTLQKLYSIFEVRTDFEIWC